MGLLSRIIYAGMPLEVYVKAMDPARVSANKTNQKEEILSRLVCSYIQNPVER